MASTSGSGKSKGNALWKSASARGPKRRKPEVGSLTVRPQKRRSTPLSQTLPARRSAVLWNPSPRRKREPTSRSGGGCAASRSSIAPRSAQMCWPSPSTCAAQSKPSAYATRSPVCTAPPMPRLLHRLITRAPWARATAAVPSREPSSTTSASIWWGSARAACRSSSRTAGKARSSVVRYRGGRRAATRAVMAVIRRRNLCGFVEVVRAGPTLTAPWPRLCARRRAAP